MKELEVLEDMINSTFNSKEFKFNLNEFKNQLFTVAKAIESKDKEIELKDKHIKQLEDKLGYTVLKANMYKSMIQTLIQGIVDDI